MGAEHAQLRLEPAAPGQQPHVRVAVPGDLAKRLGRLEPSARAELEQRLPIAVRQVFEAIAEVRSLTGDELAIRLAMSRRDAARYQAEMERRASARPGE